MSEEHSKTMHRWSINKISMSVILALGSVYFAYFLIAFGGFGFPFPAIPFIVFILAYIASLIAVLRGRLWGFLAGSASLMVTLALFVTEILGILSRPSSQPDSFIIALTFLLGAPLSVVFAIQGFREIRGRIPITPLKVSKLNAVSLIVFGVMVGSLFTAYLSSASPGGSGWPLASGSPGATLYIEEESVNYKTTKEFTVDRGDNIVLVVKNFDNQLHDITIDELGFKLNNPQRSTSLGVLTFDQVGTYTFYCSIPGHREQGMEGRIIVGD